jgi:prevent-host-death family protein
MLFYNECIAHDKEPAMQTISVRQANQNFSHYLNLVERGEEFTVTKRGKPVARLVVAHPAQPELTPAERYEQAQKWLASFKYEGVQGPFTEEDFYD